MDWITEEQAAEAAKGSELEALKHSLKHHEQGRDVSCVELSGALGSDWNRGIFHLGQKLCAICKKFAHCDRCPIGVPYNNVNADFRCCDGRWADAKKAFLALRINPSDANIATFRDAEAEVCKYIEGVIEKLEAESKKETPELRHGDLRLWRGCIGVVDKSEPAMHMVWGAGSKRDANLNEEDVLFNSKPAGTLNDIFDDIERNSEDLREFEVESDGEINTQRGQFSIRNGSNGMKWITCNNFCFTTKGLGKIHQELGRLMATLIRDEAKK